MPEGQAGRRSLGFHHETATAANPGRPDGRLAGKSIVDPIADVATNARRHAPTRMIEAAPVPAARIERAILVVRGHKVMLDSALASLYEVETRILVQAVKRNGHRFPADFMFQLTNQEVTILRSQSVISSWGGRRTAPYAFTEHGVAMLSNVLGSPRAIAVNIEIVRAFVRLREILASNRKLAQRLDRIEKETGAQFAVVFEAIRQLTTPKLPKKRPIGFVTSGDP